jgi:hypothetical protein
MPVAISFNSGYGHPLRRWLALRVGETVERAVATGTRYGFCFSQPAGHGYAATRACGTLLVHQRLNGVTLPDGPAVAEFFRFGAS